ncbi:MAG: hypothetical protein WC747_04790 [Candidatus Babeliales bacterium]|jgi:hypothetical protein
MNKIKNYLSLIAFCSLFVALPVHAMHDESEPVDIAKQTEAPKETLEQKEDREKNEATRKAAQKKSRKVTFNLPDDDNQPVKKTTTQAKTTSQRGSVRLDENKQPDATEEPGKAQKPTAASKFTSSEFEKIDSRSMVQKAKDWITSWFKEQITDKFSKYKAKSILRDKIKNPEDKPKVLDMNNPEDIKLAEHLKELNAKVRQDAFKELVKEQIKKYNNNIKNIDKVENITINPENRSRRVQRARAELLKLQKNIKTIEAELTNSLKPGEELVTSGETLSFNFKILSEKEVVANAFTSLGLDPNKKYDSDLDEVEAITAAVTEKEAALTTAELDPKTKALTLESIKKAETVLTTYFNAKPASK